jgi:hypothetical protein
MRRAGNFLGNGRASSNYHLAEPSGLRLLIPKRALAQPFGSGNKSDRKNTSGSADLRGMSSFEAHC